MKLASILIPARARYKGIRIFSKWKVWYDKGIAVLSVIRNVQIMDLGVIMGVSKYLFGDQLSNWQIVSLGILYWILNTIINTLVGWFWEHHQGWQIESEIRAQRVDASRTVLVGLDGKPYGAEDIARHLAKELKKNA